jgi:phosphatidylglycerophosphatase C
MNLALFDFDGTITTADTFTPFLRFAVRRERILVGSVILSPLILGYRLRLVSARTARPFVARFGFQGEEAAVVRQLGREYAAEIIPGVVRRRAIERIEWHKRQGDRVVVVSASLDVYLACWCESSGVDLICTQLEERGGTLTGRYFGGDCSGAEKVRRIRERYDLLRYGLIYAYGDTDDDREMLGLAHEKYYRWRKIADWQEATGRGVQHPR